ncbi:MAG: ABC transporter permease [Acidobacteriota bacterium]
MKSHPRRPREPMFKLIFSNLKQRPTRTCVSILAVGLGVALILVSVGLSYGQLNDNADRARRIGDIMIQPSGASPFFALNGGTFPVRLGRVIEGIEGVDSVTPILAKFLGDKFHLVFGIDKESFRRVNSSLRIVKGRFFEKPNEVLIDTNYSRSRKLDADDTLELLGNHFLISGIFQEGTAARVLLPLRTLQEMNGTPDKATMFFVRAEEGVVDAVYTRLKERLKNYKITKTADLQELMTSDAPVFKQFITAVVLLASTISFLMILLAMYSTITERTREIGILKSLGASKSYLVQLILKESLLICVIGVGLGFLLTAIAIKLVMVTFPSLPVDISPAWRVSAALMAVLGGVLGALYPALKAAQLDPIEALGYE